MALEDDVQRYINQQRRALIAKVEQEKRDNTAKKGVFLGLNADGTARVRVDGVEKSIKITGDVYLRKGDSVMVDELKTGEIKRRKRKRDELAKKKIQKKKFARKDKNLPSVEEESSGVFFGFTSYVNQRHYLDLHLLALYQLYEGFENITELVNFNFYDSIGMYPWLKDFGLDVGVFTVDTNYNGILVPRNGTYDIVKYTGTDYLAAYDRLLANNPDYTLISTERTLWNRFLADVEENPIGFLEFFANMLIEDYRPTILEYYNDKISYDNPDTYLFNGLNDDPIAQGKNIVLCSKIDWIYWDLPDIRPSGSGTSTPAYVPQEVTYVYPCNVCNTPISEIPQALREISYLVESYGTDNPFDTSVTLVPGTNTITFTETRSPGRYETRGCSPSNPDTYPCGPCNCGTGFFGCDYYTWVAVSCDPENDPCTPYDLCSYEKSYSSTPRVDIDKIPRTTDGNANSTGLYPSPCNNGPSFTGNSAFVLNYSKVKLLTVRDSLVYTMKSAQDAGYKVFLDLDLRFRVQALSLSVIQSYDDLLNKYCDDFGGILDPQTLVSMASVLESGVYFGRSLEYYSKSNSNKNYFDAYPYYKAAYDQETLIWIDTTERLFEEIFEEYGPVVSGSFNSLRVFYVQLTDTNEFMSKTGTIYSQRQTGDFNATLQLGNDYSASIADRIKYHITQARGWRLDGNTPESMFTGKPDVFADKTFYVNYALMCGLFGEEQLLEKDPDGDEKYRFQ